MAFLFDNVYKNLTVYQDCVTTVCMAFHERLGASSPLACLAKLDQELHMLILKRALLDRQVLGEIKKDCIQSVVCAC